MPLKKTFVGLLSLLLTGLGAVAMASESSLNLNEPLLPLVSARTPQEKVLIEGREFVSYPLAGDPACEKLLWQSYEMIFSTQAARKILADQIVIISPSVLTLIWGVPNVLAYQLEGLPVPTRRIESQVQWRERSRPVEPKSFFFLVPTDGQPLKNDSYTFDDNKTAFFLSPHTTRLDLLKMLTHEIEIGGDHLYSPDISSDPSIDASVRMFLILRAMAFERQVLSEILGERELRARSTAFENQIDSLKSNEACVKFALRYAGQTLNWDRELTQRMEKVLRMQESGINVCVVMSTPQIELRPHLSSGPRPRIGDWNGSHQAPLQAGPLPVDLEALRSMTQQKIVIEHDRARELYGLAEKQISDQNEPPLNDRPH